MILVSEGIGGDLVTKGYARWEYAAVIYVRASTRDKAQRQKAGEMWLRARMTEVWLQEGAMRGHHWPEPSSVQRRVALKHMLDVEGRMDDCAVAG